MLSRNGLIKPFVLGKPLTQFVSSCAENYLTSEHKTIRLEAVKTCASLLVPTLQPISSLTSSHTTSSASSAQIVSDILAQLLQVGITDPGELNTLYKVTLSFLYS